MRGDKVQENFTFNPETFRHGMVKLVHSFIRESFGIHNPPCASKRLVGEGNPYFV